MRVHVSLAVGDLGRSVDFYQGMLGTAPSKRHEDYANFRLDEPPLHLALVPGASTRAGNGPEHFGIELPDHETLWSWRERVRSAGISGFDEEDAQCCYATGDKLWLTDPDGHRWELWVRTGEFTAMAPKETACCA